MVIQPCSFGLGLSAYGPFTFDPMGHPSLNVQGAGEEIEFLLQDLTAFPSSQGQNWGLWLLSHSTFLCTKLFL